MTHHRASSNKSATTVLLQMAVCVVGIYACFGFWSLKQERVATQPYELEDGTVKKFRFPFVLNLVQVTISAFVAAALLVLGGQSLAPPSSPSPSSSSSSLSSLVADYSWKLKAAIIGIGCTFASPFGYAAMNQLSYPIVLTVKMGKMVPVIIIGSLWYHRRYSISKYMVVLLITSGVLAFSLLEEKHEREDTGRSSSLLGIALVFINLIMDGFVNSTQDELVRKLRWTGNRMMFVSNTSAVVCAVVALLLFELLPKNPLTSAELSEALRFFALQPQAFYDVVAMGALNAAGQFFIFQTIAIFDSLTVTAMTLVRKVGSVLLSIYVHNHNVSPFQWLALLTVFAGIVIETKINITEKSSHKQQEKVVERDNSTAVANKSKQS